MAEQQEQQQHIIGYDFKSKEKFPLIDDTSIT